LNSPGVKPRGIAKEALWSQNAPYREGRLDPLMNFERKQSYVWDLASNLFLGHFSFYPSCRIHQDPT